MQRSRRENKEHKQPQHQAAHHTQATHHTHAKTAEKQTGFLSNCPTPVAHPATTDQSDAVLHNLPIKTVSQQGMPPGREGSRCLTPGAKTQATARSETQAPSKCVSKRLAVRTVSRALVVTVATATTLRAAVLLRRIRRVLNKMTLQKGLCISCIARTLQHTCKRKAHASPHSPLSQMLEPPCHLQDSTLKWCARNLNLLKFLNTCLSKSLYK